MNAHIRPVRKTRARLSKSANAADTIAGFGKGLDVVGLTYGQFSLIDLIEATLAITGPADVTISTWSAGFYDVEAAVKFRDSGLLRSIRFVMDSSAKRGQATAGDVIDLFGPDSMRGTRSHAKFVIIANEEWDVLITSSMNLNLNPRLEQFEMTDDKERCQLFQAFVDSIWAELQPGDLEDRKLPGAPGVESVSPTFNIEVSQRVSVGKWKN